MPNYNGVWSLSTQYQYNTDWQADNVSPVRLFAAGIGLWFGGVSNSVVIDKVNISSAGNATDFGDLIAGTYGGGAVGSTTRGVMAGVVISNKLENDGLEKKIIIRDKKIDNALYKTLILRKCFSLK